MISEYLYRNPRLLVLVLAVIVVSGLSSFYVLPRMEDPVLGKRVAIVSAVFPGADAERVESLVTERLEERLRDITEIKQLQSTSRFGISSVVIELRDDVTDVDPVWSRVRDRLSDVDGDLPSQVIGPSFRRLDLKAFAAIVAVKWTRSSPPNLAILGRLAAELKLTLRGISGTEDVDLFGDPGEEIVVEIQPEVLAALGLSTAEVSQQIRESDARQPAGLLRSGGTTLLLDVDEQVDSLPRLGQTPIQYGRGLHTTRLDEIARITKGTIDPPASLALVDAQRSVVLGVLVRDDFRIDHWSDRLQAALDNFRVDMPPGIAVDLVFSQSEYVEQRLQGLLWNLLLGTLAVVVVVFFLMGWRSTVIVGTALPVSALMVLSGMRALGIPIHQISVTGLVIALGLLIDNAIVIVDEVRSRIGKGLTASQAMLDAVGHLTMPLLGSTLTTTLAFAPIALLPGPPGEFVGTLAVSVILAINASLLLALTIVPALTAMLQGSPGSRTLFSYGVTSQFVERLYKKSLAFVFRAPWLGVALGTLLPLLGFLRALTLPEQFFPPADRNQFYAEIELPARASLAETRSTAEAVRQVVMRHDQVTRMHWFLGESAPTFFYNVVPRRRRAACYGQAMVELERGAPTGQVIRELQRTLDGQFAECRVLVRQLEQGPPFDAPIEIQLRGPDLAVLQRLGSEVRLLLSQTSQVIHTRSDLEEALPKLALRVDEPEVRLAGLTHNEIARQLYTTLEGTVGGGLFEGSAELPIRVRLADPSEISLQQLGALELQSRARRGPPGTPNQSARSSSPVSALAQLELTSDVAAIPHIHGQRMNEVKAYITAGTLPSKVIAEFERNLAASDLHLPLGYSMGYAGEAAKRDEAVGNLLANATVLFALMLVTLVVSFQSFRISLIIAAVGGLSMGLGPGALSFSGHPFGFMAIVGTMGLVGVAINDAIVVMAGIREDPAARAGDLEALSAVVVGRTRHVVATTLTTIAGFMPLILGGGGFWPPLAITIAGGVGGATLLALYFVPSFYLLLLWKERRVALPEASGTRTSNVATHSKPSRSTQVDSPGNGNLDG